MNKQEDYNFYNSFMGDLPNDVRTAFVKLEAREMELLASLLLSKKKTNLVEIRHVD